MAIPALLVAAILLTLGVPRLAAVIVAAEGEPMLRRAHEQQPVSPAELETLIEAQKAAEPWVGDARVRTELGLAWLLSAAASPPKTGVESGAAFENAAAALRDGLSRAPANPYAWARLAYAQSMSSGWTPEAVAALRMSLLTAPYEPPLLWTRVQMAFLAWPRLSPDDRDLVFQQVRWAWQANPGELVRLAVQTERANVVRAALLRTPEDGAEFERLLRDRH